MLCTAPAHVSVEPGPPARGPTSLTRSSKLNQKARREAQAIATRDAEAATAAESAHVFAQFDTDACPALISRYSNIHTPQRMSFECCSAAWQRSAVARLRHRTCDRQLASVPALLSALGGRTVSLVGDSTMAQLFDMLAMRFHAAGACRTRRVTAAARSPPSSRPAAGSVSARGNQAGATPPPPSTLRSTTGEVIEWTARIRSLDFAPEFISDDEACTLRRNLNKPMTQGGSNLTVVTRPAERTCNVVSAPLAPHPAPAASA